MHCYYLGYLFCLFFRFLFEQHIHFFARHSTSSLLVAFKIVSREVKRLITLPHFDAFATYRWRHQILEHTDNEQQSADHPIPDNIWSASSFLVKCSFGVALTSYLPRNQRSATQLPLLQKYYIFYQAIFSQKLDSKLPSQSTTLPQTAKIFPTYDVINWQVDLGVAGMPLPLLLPSLKSVMRANNTKYGVVRLFSGNAVLGQCLGEVRQGTCRPQRMSETVGEPPPTASRLLKKRLLYFARAKVFSE